ncbi:DUF302 domain-containing protein [Thalassobacillus hwangdonensis]|uniref:DUF302 domain-containing protein n=1 Tax=Thalassobacillus hwangdonensis TaxID=546108 RepID=A0ABW3L301_9BACI
MFHYTVETSRSVQAAVEALEDALKSEKFGVLWDFNVKETLNGKGFDFNQSMRILEVCNPEEANKVLAENELVSYFLPCKVVVYESDGKTKIGMPKPTELIRFLDDAKLNGIAEDIEQRMIATIDSVK